MGNNTPDYEDNLLFDTRKPSSEDYTQELEKDIRILCGVLVRKCPEMESWVIKHYGFLYNKALPDDWTKSLIKVGGK